MISSKFRLVHSVAFAMVLSACGGGDTTSPAIATKLSVEIAPSTTAGSRVEFATQPVIQLQDASGNAVTQAGVVVTASIIAGGGTVGGSPAATTGSNGAATFSNLSISGIVGPHTLTFSSSGLISATATVTLTPGAISTIAANAGNNQSAIAGAAVTIAPSVKITDADGNAVSGQAVTFVVASGGGSITGASQTTNASGVATVGSWTLGTTPGANTLAAATTGLTGSAVTFTATGIVGPVASIQITPTTLPAVGDTVRLTALLLDGLGNTVSGKTVAWSSSDTSLAQVSPAGLVSTFGHGQVRLTATVDGIVAFITPTIAIAPIVSIGSDAGIGGTTCAIIGRLQLVYCTGAQKLYLSATLKRAPTTASFRSVVAGNYFACGIEIAGGVTCWGPHKGFITGDWSSFGTDAAVKVDLGISVQTLVSQGAIDFCAITPQNQPYCWGMNAGGWFTGFYGDSVDHHTPVAVGGGFALDSISLGAGRICGTSPLPVVACAGHNERGDLGRGNHTDDPQVDLSPTIGPALKVVSSRETSCGLSLTGQAYCWGTLVFEGPQLATSAPAEECSTNPGYSFPCHMSPVPVNTNLTFTAIGLGNEFACALATSGRVYCWGADPYVLGSLAGAKVCQQDPNSRCVTTPLQIALPDAVTQMSVGPQAVCVRTIKGEGYCWGWNGALGANLPVNTGVSTPVRMIDP